MQIRVEAGDITLAESPCIVVNLFEGVTSPGGATGAVDRLLGGMITDLIGTGDIRGKEGEMTLLHTLGTIASPRRAHRRSGEEHRLLRGQGPRPERKRRALHALEAHHRVRDHHARRWHWGARCRGLRERRGRGRATRPLPLRQAQEARGRRLRRRDGGHCRAGCDARTQAGGGGRACRHRRRGRRLLSRSLERALKLPHADRVRHARPDHGRRARPRLPHPRARAGRADGHGIVPRRRPRQRAAAQVHRPHLQRRASRASPSASSARASPSTPAASPSSPATACSR